MEAQSRIGHRENDMAKRLLEQVVAEDEEVLDAHSMLGQIAVEERARRRRSAATGAPSS